MLVKLSISNIVLIDKLEINFTSGFAIFTGETGAGKSILLDALNLALGGRGDSSLIRAGCEQAQIIAVFDVACDHKARQFLRSRDYDDEGDIIIKRIQLADGRSRAFVNDMPATIAFIRELASYLIEICSQDEGRLLLDNAKYREMLDNYAHSETLLTQVKDAYRSWQQAKGAYKDHKAKLEEARREIEYLKAASEELSLLAPLEGEEEQLAQERAEFSSRQRLAEEIDQAEELLNGSHSPLPPILSLCRRFERRMEGGAALLEPIAKAFYQALDALSHAQDQIREAKALLDFDPAKLELLEERLFALRAAARKYQHPVSELNELLNSFQAQLKELDEGEDMLNELAQKFNLAQADYDEKAAALSLYRKEAAASLRDDILQQLPDLKLERADFFVHFSSDKEQRSPYGIDFIDFYVRTNPGTQAGSLLKIASGGELSRFLLALKLVLAQKSGHVTLVFDEIDTGAGGSVADAIGHKLYLLSRHLQVLSITHAPQVAARAQQHFLLRKNISHNSSAKEDETKDITTTTIQLLDEELRLEEIARMLSGRSITCEARAAAKKLLLG